MKKNYIKSLALFTILTLIIGYAIINDNREWKVKEMDIMNTLGPPPSVSSKAESFVIADMNGDIIKSEQMNEGNHMLILWSFDETDISKQFLDIIDELVASGECKNMNILPINIGDNSEEVKEFFIHNNYNIECYTDVNKTTKWAFNWTKYLPIVYIIDSDGTIRFRQEVGLKAYNDVFLKRIAKLNDI